MAPEKDVSKVMAPPLQSKKIWIDLDNTPHIPFFIPIIQQLEKRGHQVWLTARDAYQVCELASQKGLRFKKIGRHHGKHLLFKVTGWLWRSAQLIPLVLRERPNLALSHGSRSQIFISNILRIPSVLIMDYEHSKAPPFCRPQWEIIPDVVPTESVPGRTILKYAGIKEDVYAPSFLPDPAIKSELGLADELIIVTVRPPAIEAHYHNPESELLFETLMDKISQDSRLKVILLPRNKRQEQSLRSRKAEWFADGRVVIPNKVVDGLNLLWHSDLVVSGGGTMNREAAALGIPVYSIFRGPIGAVDRWLQHQKRLVLVESRDDVLRKVAFKKRQKNLNSTVSSNKALPQIISHLESILNSAT